MSRISILCLLLFPSLFTYILLAADKPVGVDQYGDPLPPDALARLGTVRFRQGTQIHSLAYSPDGKVIASGGNDGRIVLWDAQSGKMNREFQATSANVATLAFSSDGRRLVSVSELARAHSLYGREEIWVWEVSTGKVVQRLEPEGWTSALALSPDGHTIARTDNSDCIRTSASYARWNCWNRSVLPRR
jgi:WD40 repeat protein